MINEEIIKDEMIHEANKEISRLKNIIKEKDKLPAMARIVISTSTLVAIADGKTTADEVLRIQKDIFNKFCINEKIFKKYIPMFNQGVSTSYLQDEIEKYNIDKNFLNDLYTELRNMKLLEKLTRKEEELFFELVRIFDIPSTELENEHEEEPSEEDSTGYNDYYPEDEKDDSEANVEIEETE